jgi:WhiB family transcriptional regulator, redox-sensing transcriptional regulator
VYWRDVFPGASNAACLGADPDALFAETFEEQDAVIRALCAECPCREACLEYALVHRIKEGVWGGMTPRQRAKICARTPAQLHPVTCDGCFKVFQPSSTAKIYCSLKCANGARRQARALSRDVHQHEYRKELHLLLAKARLRGVESNWRPRWEKEAKPLVTAARRENWDPEALKARLKDLAPPALRPDPRWRVTKGDDRPRLLAQIEKEARAARFGKELPEEEWTPSGHSRQAAAWNGGGYRERVDA